MVDGSRYKVTIEGRYATIDVAVQNVLWFGQEGPDVSGTHSELLLANRLAARLAGADWAQNYRWCLSTGFAVLNLRVQQVFPDSTGAYVVPVNVGGRSGPGNAYVPSGASLVIRLRSTRNNRQGRGRVYLGGFAQLAQDFPTHWAFDNEGYWSDEYVRRAVAWLADLQTAAAPPAAGEPLFRWGVWSKLAAGPSPPYADGFAPMADFSGSKAIRYQRRREVGVGI